MDSQIVSPERPILGIDRRSGEFVALVPSASVAGKFHVTTESSCDCKGFSYRRGCRHLTPAPQRAARQPLIPGRLSA